MQDTSQSSHWTIPQTTTAVVVRMLKPGEDEIVQVSLLKAASLAAVCIASQP